MFYKDTDYLRNGEELYRWATTQSKGGESLTDLLVKRAFEAEDIAFIKDASSRVPYCDILALCIERLETGSEVAAVARALLKL